MQITVCDICGTQKNVQQVSLTYDRRTDAAGSSEDVYETFDLCCKCYLKALKTAIKEEIRRKNLNEHLFNKNLIEIIRIRQETTAKKWE